MSLHELKQREDGLLESRFYGQVTAQSVAAFVSNVTPYLERATSQDRLYFLAFAFDETGWDTDAKHSFGSLFAQEPRLGAVAVIDATMMVTVSSETMSKRAGVKERVRFFSREDVATEWLNSIRAFDQR
jgi:hypothetical protein